MPFSLARSAISLPTSAAAAMLPPYFFSSVFLPMEEAEAMVTPLRSSDELGVDVVSER